MQFTQCFQVSTTGEVFASSKAETLYMTRDFDDIEKLSKNEVFNLFKTNLASIARYKMESQNKKAVISTAELSDLKLVENQ